jgi:hypothetical protein
MLIAPRIPFSIFARPAMPAFGFHCLRPMFSPLSAEFSTPSPLL